MIAYHGKRSEKAEILKQPRAHAKADEIVKGQYWENGRGCAIGCQIHSGNHAEYEPRFGIPWVLAHLEDQIFESLPNKGAVTWPVRFMSAIKPGADLSCVWPDFAVWMLTDPEFGVLRFARTDETRETVQTVADLYAQREPAGSARWEDARASAAFAPTPVAYAAASAATSVAYAAASAATSVAYAAGAYADGVYAAARAYGNARERFWLGASKKLLELLSSVKDGK